jgi:hypothetical protein
MVDIVSITCLLQADRGMRAITKSRGSQLRVFIFIRQDQKIGLWEKANISRNCQV